MKPSHFLINGEEEKKRKSEASWVISFLILENSQHFLFSYVSSKERREIIREREHKIRNIFAIFSSITYIYIYLSFIPRRRIFLLKRFVLPLFLSILLAFKTARNAFIRVTRGLERTAPSSGVSENSPPMPSSLLAIKPGGLESSHRANQRAIMLFFPLQVAPSALGSSNEGSKLVLINLVTPKELEIRFFGLERISRIFMNDKIKIESNSDLELLTNK